ncbi:putative ribonuclease H-like domain-containing protein [Tanacetum coccineum]|uniref:Ribonuclease H-like domain-containing protein n=1 Tax=Tanacetum coccineum TaxID=301880 RepID=A0ABQ5HZS0_9ASTR
MMISTTIFKIIEQEVKGTASSSSSSQNMAFVSSPSSTNEVNTAYRVSTANTQVSPASTQVSTSSTQVSTANLSDDTVYAFLASQPNGSQLVYEDLEQIHEDDIEEIDLKWQLALLSMRTRRFFQKTSRKITINESDTAGYDKFKVECFNCRKMGHFARECRGPKNQDNRNKNQDSSRRTINLEEISSKAMLAIDGADDKLEKKTIFPTIAKIEFVRAKQQEKPVKKLVKYAEMYKSQSPSFDHVQANCNYHQRERVVFGNNYTRVNYNYYTKKAHPSAHRNMAPRAVLMKTGLRPLNTARPVNTVHPKTTVHSARPMPKAVNTARPNSAVVNAVRENEVNAVKASACWGHPKKEDQCYVDSGCSRHMTGNMSYLLDFKEFDGGYVTFGGGAKGGKITGKGTLKTADESQVLLKVPRKNNMYSVDMKNIVPKESLTCLVAKATLDESMIWHRRLGHVNFKTINKLVKDNLVRGLPSKRFENDQTCVACLKGNQHKASSSKDETSGILKSFITEIENLVDKKVKIIRCDNGTEFKNRVMSDFCEKKGIKREFSVARTPQQNGVAERRNRTLIEAARTMSILGEVTGSSQASISSSSKDSPDAGFKPSEDEEKKDAKDPENKDKNNVTDENIVYGCDDDPNMRNLEEIVYSDDDEGVDAKADMTNLDTNIFVSPTLTTRIHKDHPLEQIIRDIHSAPQTRRMTKNVTKHVEPKKTLMDLPHGKRAIGTKWVYRNKKDERGIVIRNKARIEAIRLFLAYASFKYFVVYQMDVKSAFLYGKIEEEVYVCQPLGFEDPEFPDRVYKVEKALYGLYQAHSAWYETLSTYLLDNRFQRGQIDKSLFIKRVKGLQVTQKDDGIFISQDKYVGEIFKKFGFSTVKTASTPMDTSNPLLKDAEAKDVVVHLYRSMIGSLMYLTASRPDIMFVQTIVANSTTEAEYVAASSCCGQMSSIGELTFFLGLQVTQKDDGIFISQDKYVDKILKKLGFSTVKTASTPMETSNPLLIDAEAEDVVVHLYR